MNNWMDFWTDQYCISTIPNLFWGCALFCHPCPQGPEKTKRHRGQSKSFIMPLSYETSGVPGFYSLTKRGIYRPKNVQTLTKCPELANMDNIQCFLGFPNFYWWFIKYHSIICKPLLNLIKRGDNFLFNNQTWAGVETVSTCLPQPG